MDDTKKLIEKYKRELMELSRRTPKPAPVPIADSEPASAEPVNNAENAEQASSASAAQVSAVQSEGASAAPENPAENERKPQIIGYVSEESGEFPAVYDRFLAEIIETDESIAPTDIDEQPDTPNAAPAAEQEQTEQSARQEQPDNGDVIDISDVLFTPPKYTEIPSTQRVREEITEQSDPNDNIPTENVSGVTDNSNPAPPPPFAPTESVSKEKAETLADQPISGKDENEQLTGRSFEDESYPQNTPNPDADMRQGSGAQPADYPPPDYKTYEEFAEKNTGNGTMLFRVYTAQEALPVEGAKCVISKRVGGERRELYSLLTDSSGQTRAENLPAPSKELSQSYSNSIQPFALYDATVSRNDYAVVELKDIPVFDGVQSIQRVAMVPVPPNIRASEEITEVENAR